MRPSKQPIDDFCASLSDHCGKPLSSTVYILTAIMGYLFGVPLALLVFYHTSASAITLPAEVYENRTALGIPVK